MAQYGLIKSFGIDDGELDNISPQQCFVLGYELAQIDQLLTHPAAISKPVNAANRERIEAACRQSGRPCSLNWLQGDLSESWMQLEVPALSRSAGAN